MLAILYWIFQDQKDLNFKPTKSTAELMLDAHNYYINNSNDNQKGSSVKPKMGFFKIIKFISKIISSIFN